MANKVYCELSENLKRIEVHFSYDEGDIARIKGHRPNEYGDGIAGRRWDAKARVWTAPRNLKSARRLREVFGERMELGPALRTWARQEVNEERNLRSLRNANDAELDRTPQIILEVIAGKAIDAPGIPKRSPLRKSRDPRPYQRADIKIMSMHSLINANDVGVGKSLEVCGAVYEAGLFPKPILVVAPKRTLVSVWKTEFERWTDYNVLTSESPTERRRMTERFVDNYFGYENDFPQHNGEPQVLAIIAGDLRLEKYPRTDKPDLLHAGSDYRGNWYRFKNELQKTLFDIQYGAFVVDEFHMTGLPSRKSLFHVAAQLVKSERRWPLSATPMGGKARRLWPTLNFINKESFSSEWGWVGEYLEVTKDEIYVKGGNTRKVYRVGGIKDEVAFNDAHRQYIVRRTKREALPGLPSMVEILVNTSMTKRQEKQYKEFDKAHEIMINGKRLSGPIVLAQYLRLRQIANTTLVHEDDRWSHTQDGGKYEDLLERLNENGIVKKARGSDVEPEPGARAYVGVLDRSYAAEVSKFLSANGIRNDLLTGETEDSRPILEKFSSDDEDPYVIVMTVQTGGSGLNLEEANSAHLLEEPWDPDLEYQFFGRGDRGSRTTPLKCYIYRAENTIQEYVAEVAFGKKLTNNNILGFVSRIEEMRKRR